MAPKKKSDEDEVREGARAVGKAAKSFAEYASLPKAAFSDSDTWGETAKNVADLDQEFLKEEMLNKIKRGDVDVRVMQIGPNGALTDVSDKVNPRDLRPGDIGGIRTEDG